MILTLSLEKRDVGNADTLRAKGIIPGVVYGPGMESIAVSVAYTTFTKLYDEAGESTLVDITIPGSEPIKGLIQDVQYDPVKGTVSHVDFRQIDMTKEMTAYVELTFVGEAPAEKTLGGTLVKPLSFVNIKCLPKDLISDIEVDVSILHTFDDVIHVGDLPIPAGVTITDNVDTVVAKVSPPLTEEQLKAMEEEGARGLDSVEVEEKGKKEEAGAGAEGAAEEKKKEA